MVSYATILSVATAAAWGIAAYYWASWWMFGANIPFAIASTVQAGLMTADMGIAWADYAFNESAIRNISNFHKDPLYEYLKYLINLIKKFGKWYIRKILNTDKNVSKNTISNMKNFIKEFKNKIIGSISSKITIKSGIAATSWASPIGLSVISVIYSVLNKTNQIINFAWN